MVQHSPTGPFTGNGGGLTGERPAPSLATPSIPARHRVVTWEDPLLAAGVSKQLSGLDFLRGIQQGRVPPPPLMVLMGLSLVEVEHGRAIFSLDVGEHLYNPIGSVHGGVFCTILDSAMGCAVHSTLPAGRAYTTVALNVNLVKPLDLATPTVSSEGNVISAGRRVATASARVLGRRSPLRARDNDLFAFRRAGGQTGGHSLLAAAQSLSCYECAPAATGFRGIATPRWQEGPMPRTTP